MSGSLIIRAFIFYLLIGTALSDQTDDKQASCDLYRYSARATNILRFNSKICCESEIGCFTNDKTSNWNHISTLPECAATIRPQFFLFSPDTSEQRFNYTNDINLMSKLVLKKERPFVVVVHGYLTKWETEQHWMFTMKNVLIDSAYNVLLVRWCEGSNKIDYSKAAANIRSVGSALTVVMKLMSNSGKIDLQLTTIVGFSLGAHVAGYAGRSLAGLKQIIGLDPAGPLFACENEEVRLDPSDASFVQVIHTNGDVYLKGGLGTMQSLGHVDFYPNGGENQPGCQLEAEKTWNRVTQFQFGAVFDQLVKCSHSRAPILLIEMIKNEKRINDNARCSFVSFRCENTANWRNGDCFLCKDADCLVPGLTLVWNDRSKYRGRFYFNTLSLDESSTTLCGKQMRVSLKTDTDVEGSVDVKLMSQNYDSGLINFQKDGSDNKITKAVWKKKVLTIPWTPQNLDQVQITYKKGGFWLFGGPNSFSLTDFTVEDSEGKKKQICSNIMINNNQPILADLFETCSKVEPKLMS